METTKTQRENAADTERRIARYMNDETTPAESAAAEQWLHAHIVDPAYDELFNRLLEQTTAGTTPGQTQRAYERIDRMIAAREEKPAPVRRPLHRLLRITEYAAVAAALIISMTLYFMPKPEVEWLEAHTELAQTREIILPDSTRIWLNAGTRVMYPSRFDAKTRRIYIDGEIFADVAKDPRHPFIVSASGVEVHVLGTQFSVKSYVQNPNVEVALIRGSVAMRAGREEKAVDCTLKVGDMVRYNRVSGEMEAYHINTETYGSWYTDGSLCFVNQSLADIAADLERRFGVQIVIRDRQLASVQYYASFVNNETLDQILRTLNSNNSIRISRVNDTIILSSN